MSDEKLPQGWQERKLGEILPAEAVEPVEKVIARIKSGELLDNEIQKELRKVLEPHKTYLEERQVDYRYLSYWLEHAASTGKI